MFHVYFGAHFSKLYYAIVPYFQPQPSGLLSNAVTEREVAQKDQVHVYFDNKHNGWTYSFTTKKSWCIKDKKYIPTKRWVSSKTIHSPKKLFSSVSFLSSYTKKLGK